MAIEREGPQQRNFFTWLHWAHRDVYALAFHIPNGGQRHKAIARKMKGEGVKKGVPDIMIALPRGDWSGLFIEFKAARPHSASVSKEQKEWIAALNRVGYLAVVCRGVDEAKKAVEAYLQADEVVY